MNFIKKDLSEKGQAIFEFIVFMPFFLIVLAGMITIGGAINGAINQQKVVRGYFYSRLFNNSNVIDPVLLGQLQSKGIASAGVYSLGWHTKMVGETPVAPCYELPKLLVKGNPAETCEEPVPSQTDESMYIRVKTVYGLCGNSYQILGPGQYTSVPNIAASYGGCMLGN